MAVPKLGVDGHRRLTVTFTLLDDDADLLWAVAYLSDNRTSTTSRVAKQAVLMFLHSLEGDELREARSLIAAKERHASNRQQEPPRLRVVR